jgi:hypothetical protein
MTPVPSEDGDRRAATHLLMSHQRTRFFGYAGHDVAIVI